MKKVGLLYDSMSDNTGDIAVGIALQQGLAERGVETEIINPYNSNNIKKSFDQIIVGGGQLLRNPGDKFYDNFRIKGEFILNSVGVSGTEDFGYLSDYKFISTRSSRETSILSKYVERERIKTLPCTTTILSSPKYDLEKNIGPVDENEILVGIHLVPDIEVICPDIIDIINDIPYKKIFIPFTHYNHDKSFMENLPIDHKNSFILGENLTPLELHSIIGQMTFTLVCSLHASIFSYSQNVPFLSMYQEKVHDYFSDRKLEKFIFRSQEEVVDLLHDFKQGKFPNFAEAVIEDRQKVNKYLDIYLQLINERTEERIVDPIVLSEIDSKQEEQEEIIHQKIQVIQGRDRLLHYLNRNISSLKNDKNSMQNEYNKLKKDFDRISFSKSYKIGKIITKPFRFLRKFLK
ncbi:MAG TPA: polysaccharide pyruvyl transferase family protein [Lactovum miscens]|uniref:polysaccharide pyruvyl transferase family protein n=1 Tax=Lactovum miscens TaxID=190387 RepID=UPI002ED8D763